jgi:glycosyltransferase involved in cell wall biosynthesis
VTGRRAHGGGRARADVLLVSLGSTGGWLSADDELRGALERAGVNVAVCRARRPRPQRTFMLTDLAWAWAARAAALEGLERHAPRATIYSTTTAALLWPSPGAIRFDALAAANRPGRHGVWQRPLERRRLLAAPLLLPWSQDALRERCGATQQLADNLVARALVVPVAVESSGPIDGARDVAAVTYAANPTKKGTARVLEAWSLARKPGEQLVVVGSTTADLRRAGIVLPDSSDGVRVADVLARDDYRALLRRTRVFVCAPSREDYGIAQLEALADGCMLVTGQAPGPYAALPLARELDGRLVGEDLAGALRAALDSPRAGYQAQALEALAAFSRASVDGTVARALVPRLLGSDHAW